MIDFTGRDGELLMLNDPAEFERLLHSYTLLLGQRKLWWQRVADAEGDRWASAVRRAIVQVAERSDIPPTTLAEWLDDSEVFAATRALILNIARNSTKGRA